MYATPPLMEYPSSSKLHPDRTGKAQIKQHKKICTSINVHWTKYQKSLPRVHFHKPHTTTGQGN